MTAVSFYNSIGKEAIFDDSNTGRSVEPALRIQSG